MNGDNSILDTNTVLYLLGGKIESNNLPDGQYFISFITEMELLSFPEIRKSEENKIRDFISNIKIIELNSLLKTETIKLRKSIE